MTIHDTPTKCDALICDSSHLGFSTTAKTPAAPSIQDEERNQLKLPKL